MATEPEMQPRSEEADPHDAVELPAPTVWPMVLSLGVALIGVGVATSLVFSIVGAVIFVAGLAGWISQLLPGRGHAHEPLVAPDQRPRPVAPVAGSVEQYHDGLFGRRVQLPEKIHPISAGVKGGLVGGLVLPVPALIYGIVSGHTVWYPVNLLAGMALPGLGDTPPAELNNFHLGLLLAGMVIHVAVSLVFGLIYGVLLPTLPDLPNRVTWGGLLMPLFWTSVSFSVMGFVNPVMYRDVDWPWFIISQFIFGVAAAAVVDRTRALGAVRGGLMGGAFGGVVMALPAFFWGLASGHGIWYPVNLLAGMVVSGMDRLPNADLQQFHGDWFLIATLWHFAVALTFGVVYGLILPKLPQLPGAIIWGGVVLPLLWTGVSYGLMGIVNPALQQRVDWPWFIMSQFAFGVAAAVVVHRSAKIAIPPVGASR